MRPGCWIDTGMLTLRRQASKSEPLERREQLAQASAARAKRDGRVGMLVIWVGVAIFLFGFLVVCVLWYAAGIREQLMGLPLLLVWAFSLAVVQQGRRMRAGG